MNWARHGERKADSAHDAAAIIDALGKVRPRPDGPRSYQFSCSCFGFSRSEPPGAAPQPLPDDARGAECTAQIDGKCRPDAKPCGFPQRAPRRHSRSCQPGEGQSDVVIFRVSALILAGRPQDIAFAVVVADAR